MRRNKWKVELQIDELFEAAKEKMEFHQERLKVWADKRDSIKKDLQEKGVKIEESVMASDQFYASSVSNSLRRQPMVSLDSDLVNDLNECLQKVSEHQLKIKEYDHWMQFFEGVGGTFKLNQDDWLFFFGK